MGCLSVFLKAIKKAVLKVERAMEMAVMPVPSDVSALEGLGANLSMFTIHHRPKASRFETCGKFGFFGGHFEPEMPNSPLNSLVNGDLRP